MMKPLFLLVGAGLLAGASSAPGEPIIRACLERHSDGAKQARIRVTIDWNGYRGTADRFDIGAIDAGNDIWPQLRDERMQPRPGIFSEMITVSDVSRYPLTFRVLRFVNGAARAFDEECRDGFCSLREPLRNVEILGDGGDLPSPEQAPRCPRER